MASVEVQKPVEMVLVRHGESEANVIHSYTKKGLRMDVPGFTDRHESLWRLSPRGIEQAKKAGEFVMQNILEPSELDFRYLVSPHNRTMETAVNMEIAEEWEPRVEIREREWAAASYLSPEERREQFELNEKIRDMSYYYWTPPYGESIAGMVDGRTREIIKTIYREEVGNGVMMVTHGEFMWGMRVPMEKLHPLEFNEQDKDRAYNIPNCMVLQYSRKNPETGDLAEHFNWRRAVCPWDATKSWNNGEWVQVHAGRRKITTAQLRKFYEATEPLSLPARE